MDRQERPAGGPRHAVTPRRVFLHLVACTALALGLALNRVWALGPRQRKGSAAIEIQLDVARLDEHIALLAAWFGRARRRPRWTAHERFLILEHAERHHLSAADRARDFLLSEATVHRWRKARRSRPAPDASEPGTGTNRLPPCRRICDSRRALVARMAVAGFGGHRTIERHLKLQGESLSARSIQRFRRTPSTPQTTTPRPRTLHESPEPLDQALALAAGRIGAFRPRVARLLRVLADALGEGIAAGIHSALERSDQPGEWADRAETRSRRAAQLGMLLSRLARIPPRHRPRYTAEERARILAFKYRFRLSNELLARWFVLDPATLSGWNRDADDAEPRGRPLVATLPDTDSAINLVASTLRYVPRRLKETVAQTLATLAHKVPQRRAWKPRRRRMRAGPRVRGRTVRSPLVPKRPNHFWGSDLTTLELRFKFYLGAIVDLYSRDILAWRLFPHQPASAEMAALFEKAVAHYGKPEHFVSDQGGQFVGEALRTVLERLGVDSRHGAVGQKGSIAIVERMWRSLKEHIDLRGARSEIAAVLERRVAPILDYYRTKRPHAALANATPHQVFKGLPAPAHNPRPAPRGNAGDNAPAAPFVVHHVFPLEKKLPYLERIA